MRTVRRTETRRTARGPALPHGATGRAGAEDWAGWVPGGLARTFLPQVEQFGMALHRSDDLLVGRVSDDLADAEVAVCPVGAGCIVVSHRIRMRRDMPFIEHSGPSLCLCSLSRDSLALCPVAQPRTAARREHIAVFGQQDGERSSWLRAGSHQDATSIMLLPSWFARLEGRERTGARELIEEPGEACDEEAAAILGQAMRAVTPRFGRLAGNAHDMDAKVRWAVRRTVAWRRERMRAELASGTREQAKLARAAKQLIARNLGARLSIDALARDLFCSRTRLCAAFKRETGASVGAYIRDARMRWARELLGCRALDVAEVARTVGYDRPASFTVAFEHAHGCSPTAWRAEHVG